jgi:hypothetical protein
MRYSNIIGTVRSCIWLASLSVSSLVAADSIHAGKAYVKDGSFESPTADRTWRIDFVRQENKKSTQVEFAHDGRSYLGQRALHIRSAGQGSGYAIVSQTITFPRPHPTVLYVGAAVNAEVDRYTKLYAHAEVEGEDKTVHLTNATNFRATQGWRRENVKWTCAGKPIRSVRFMVIFNGTGWALWDDLQLTTQPREASPLAAETPWLTIPRLARGPTSSDDWQAAQVLSNFTLLGSGKFADAQTRVRLGYTAEAIHVRAECDEPLLDPIHNSTTAFRAKVTGRDAYVFSDDCLELFFDPDGIRNEFTQLGVNSLATQWDARKGQKAWDGTWSAKAGKGTSSWWCEVEVPLEDLGLSAAEERAGTLNVARERKAVKELSTYSPLSAGFGEPARFATMRLGPPAPSVEVTWRSRSETLRGVEYRIHNSTSEAQSLVCGLAQSDDEKRVRELLQHVTVAPGSTKTLAMDIPREDLNWTRSRGFVRSRDDGRYLQITPWFQTKPSGIIASFALESTADFTVTYNNHPLNLAKGEGNRWLGKVRLHEGNNALAVQLSNPGKWRCRVWDDKTTLNVVSDAGWMTCTAEPNPSWVRRTFQPSSGTWAHVAPASPPAAEETWAGAEWIKGAAGSAFLRHVRYGMTRYVPESSQAKRYPFYEKHGQIAKIYTLNPGSHTQPDYEMVIETSPAITLNSPVGRLNYKMRSFVPIGMVRTKLPDGWERNTIRFSNYLWPHKDAATLTDDVSGVNKHGLPLLARPVAPGPAALRIYSRSRKGFITEVPRLVEYDRQPFPEGRRIPGFEVYMWGNPCFDHAEGDWPHLLDMYQAAGITTCLLGHLGGGDPMVTPRKHWRWSTGHRDGYRQLKRFVSYAKSRGFRLSANIHWPIDQPDWLKDHPEDGAVHAGSAGKKHKTRVPMVLLLDRQHGVYAHWRERLTACLRDLPLDEVCWDWEASPFLGSYDDRTLAGFRQYAKLPKGTKLGEEIIREGDTLSEKWIAFRCEQVVQVSAAMREIIREASPDTVLSFYSGYPHYSRSKYTTDWEALAKVADVALAGYHALWNGNARILADIMGAEGKPSLPGLDIYARSHRAEMLGVKLAQALTEGGRGAMIFASGCSNMNLTALASVASVTRFLPELEPFLLSLDRQDRLVEAKAPATVLKHGDRYLISLQNRSSDPVDCALRWKGPEVRSVRVLGQKDSKRRVPREIALQPFSVTWVVLQCAD